LKPSFNNSVQNWLSTPQKAFSATEVGAKTAGRVMATITSDSPSQAKREPAIRGFWRQFFFRAFAPYRPELHYMRGPGPAWHAKHKAVSPAVQSMVVEIRAAKAVRSSAHS
jgi:hypothetical protein